MAMYIHMGEMVQFTQMDLGMSTLGFINPKRLFNHFNGGVTI